MHGHDEPETHFNLIHQRLSLVLDGDFHTILADVRLRHYGRNLQGCGRSEKKHRGGAWVRVIFPTLVLGSIIALTWPGIS